jgi:hypothetical protein
MSTETLIALIIALLTAISLIVSTIYLAKNLKQETRLRTLEYATAEFNRLEELGSRNMVRKLKEKTVLDYLNTLPEPEREEMKRRALQTVYVFNRIGAGIYNGVFARDIVFQLWTPQWIEWHWDRFESFVRNEREQRGEEASSGYIYFGFYFSWLAQEVKCSKVKTKYPQPLVPTTTSPITNYSKQVANSTVAMSAGIAMLILAVNFVVPHENFYGVIFGVSGIAAVAYAMWNWRRIP